MLYKYKMERINDAYFGDAIVKKHVLDMTLRELAEVFNNWNQSTESNTYVVENKPEVVTREESDDYFEVDELEYRTSLTDYDDYE